MCFTVVDVDGAWTWDPETPGLGCDVYDDWDYAQYQRDTRCPVLRRRHARHCTAMPRWRRLHPFDCQPDPPSPPGRTTGWSRATSLFSFRSGTSCAAGRPSDASAAPLALR
jgi:hypothetical protein